MNPKLTQSALLMAVIGQAGFSPAGAARES